MITVSFFGDKCFVVHSSVFVTSADVNRTVKDADLLPFATSW